MASIGLGLSPSELEINFKKYNRSNTGLISQQEFKEMYARFGVRLSDAALAYFDHCDKDKDGRLSFEEFKAFMNCDPN